MSLLCFLEIWAEIKEAAFSWLGTYDTPVQRQCGLLGRASTWVLGSQSSYLHSSLCYVNMSKPPNLPRSSKKEASVEKH